MRKELKTEYDKYYNILDDPLLLKNAIKIGNRLAVPVGGKRISGCVDVYKKSFIPKVIRKLKLNNGFPNIRLSKEKLYRVNNVSGKLYRAWEIEWGMDVMEKHTTLEKGRMYGYKESILF